MEQKLKEKVKKDGVTLQTIADALGVSRTTVSNAFNRPDQMTPKLRKKIMSKAGELGYCGPDPTASALRKGRSHTIGILFTESLYYAVSDPVALALLQGITGATEKVGVKLLLLPSPEDRSDTSPVREAVADGFIAWAMPTDDPPLRALLGRRLPTVIVDGPREGGAAWIAVDDRGGARDLARHLVSLGHRDFALITWPLAEDDREGLADLARQQSVYATAQDRLNGYAESLVEAGISWERVPVYECPINETEPAKRAANFLLDRSPRPTAIMAMSDLMALATIEVAQERGLNVPGDLSVGGYDDIPAAAQSKPSLTTVWQPLRKKGELAAEWLMQGWEGEPPATTLPTRLVVRDSTGDASYKRSGRALDLVKGSVT
jgi:DNA-binding LacI/PurR family transcriptional regulator